MPVIRNYKKGYLHSFSKNSLRGRVLHSLHSRPMLLFVCSLVILECLCVMAELMVDLHGIRMRFDHEEQELKKFVETMKSGNGDCMSETNSLGGLIELVISTYEHKSNTTYCHRTANNENDVSVNGSPDRRRRSLYDIIVQNQKIRKQLSHNFIPANILKHELTRETRSVPEEYDDKSQAQVFIFSLNVDNDNYFVISTFEELTRADIQKQNKSSFRSENDYYNQEYEKIQKISHTIKYIGFSILSLMVIETILKMLCLGVFFFRKKIEVFDAFIVLVSFALDVVFIDSNWYETGKDATTVLVLLLPWRIVRIINSFVMTINHKHHIELMTVKRSKKKVVEKLTKLRHLMIEMRHDIDLLITLSKSKGASDAEIFSCIYGKGRGTKSLTAITSFASLMFISTLGKDPCNRDEDEMYGELIRDILGNDDDDEDETEKTTTDVSSEKLVHSSFKRVATEESLIVPNIQNLRTSSVYKKEKSETKTKMTRRATLPRRHKSCGDGDNPVYYINDAYDVEEDLTNTLPPLYDRRNVQSLPHICSSVRGKNFLTFEVTTQVTYL